MPFDLSPPAQAEFLVPDIRCGGCIGAIERKLGTVAGIQEVRVNLTTKRVRIGFDPACHSEASLSDLLDGFGYPPRRISTPGAEADAHARTGRQLLLRLGVAGFAAMNVMLLSVSIWSGADAAMRDLLHWVSALIAIPAIAYAGQPFFRGAVTALRTGNLTMDVPISLAVTLAVVTSVFETAASGQHAYFDAGISLVFFLLIGRYLDHRTRASARSAASELALLTAETAEVVGRDGTREHVAVEALLPGMVVHVAAGERIPADGVVSEGTSDIDRSLVTGESMPEAARPGDQVLAGMLSLTAPLSVRLTATGPDTVLAEIARMVDAAERGKSRHDRLADRAARLYVPVVHALAALAFAGWYGATGDAHKALTIATAVLIITCPCALALAIPAVHAAASARLFQGGIFLKDGADLERLAEIDQVVFDKTGTLTDGLPTLDTAPPDDDPAWPIAMAVAMGSGHPLSVALVRAARARGISPAEVTELDEIAGCGVSARFAGLAIRLGKPAWVGAAASHSTAVALRVGAAAPVLFTFAESLRPEARETAETLRGMGLKLTVLSGDVAEPVRRIADALEIGTWDASLSPADKHARLAAMAETGSRVLMVGDGLNDAPALAAAHASMSPASAADVSRVAAGLVFTGQTLRPVAFAVRTARAARARAMENFAFAALYNMVAVPLAMSGMVTPLIAALAMSGSSLVVTLNALRLRRMT